MPIVARGRPRAGGAAGAGAGPDPRARAARSRARSRRWAATAACARLADLRRRRLRPAARGAARGRPRVVGTPGRILDHLTPDASPSPPCASSCFDEADELLSLGFWPDMREIRYLPAGRAPVLPVLGDDAREGARALARLPARSRVRVDLEGQSSPPRSSTSTTSTTAQEKEKNLARILEYEEPESAIVFCNTKDDVRYVTAFLQRRGLRRRPDLGRPDRRRRASARWLASRRASCASSSRRTSRPAASTSATSPT